MVLRRRGFVYITRSVQLYVHTTYLLIVRAPDNSPIFSTIRSIVVARRNSIGSVWASRLRLEGHVWRKISCIKHLHNIMCNPTWTSLGHEEVLRCVCGSGKGYVGYNHWSVIWHRWLVVGCQGVMHRAEALKAEVQYSVTLSRHRANQCWIYT